MDVKTVKPRMIFFQWDHRDLPEFLKLHMQLHVKCLSEFFEVILINQHCDYQQICEEYKPDICLFESGYRTSISKKIVIKNTSFYPEIPKLGLHNGDSWCDCRSSFIYDMEQWGIETYFSISTTTAEHTPKISDNLFVWPNFIDSDIFKDYEQSKVIPVLFNGSMSSLYPWRKKIFEIVSNRFPSLIFNHLGYESLSSLMIHGEKYSRTINASWFVPACGTVANELIRKHFEVPGSKACLVTEKSSVLEAAGFVDMQNCVFADEKDVVSKLEYLFLNTDELNKIIKAGYELVQTRHTLKQRDQIFQWFNLNKDLGSDEKIIQTSPFEPLRVVKKSSGSRNSPVFGNGLHLQMLRHGDMKLKEGSYEDAAAFYSQTLNYVSYMHEPKLKLVICNLHQGNTANAFYWIREIHLNNFVFNAALQPDPIEWVYLIITLLCQGKLNEATIRARQFSSINHFELDRIRWVVNFLQDDYQQDLAYFDSVIKSRASIHQLPKVSFEEWIYDLCNMLKSCRQSNYAEMLRNSLLVTENCATDYLDWNDRFLKYLKKNSLKLQIKCIENANNLFKMLHIPAGRDGIPSVSIGDYAFRLLKWGKIFIVKSSSRGVIFNLSKTNN